MEQPLQFKFSANKLQINWEGVLKGVVELILQGQLTVT